MQAATAKVLKHYQYYKVTTAIKAPYIPKAE